MSQGATAKASNTRALVLERRRALSAGGKAALKTQQSTATDSVATTQADVEAPRPAPSRPAAVPHPASGGGARAASLARRKAMSSRGKVALDNTDRTRSGPRSETKPAPAATESQPSQDTERSPADCGCGCGGRKQAESASEGFNMTSDSRRTRTRAVRRPKVAASPAKSAALARRKALSSRGKAGLAKTGLTEAQAARASNPQLTGRELAQMVREQRSRRGGAGQKKSTPCGRSRKSKDTSVGAAQDAPWKVGASETSSGQTVTGTMVGRKGGMTGDEPSTCRTITGTEYLGADIFREFCQTEATHSTAKKVMVTSTSHGNAISGNRLGRASNVTGNEPGTCKHVTGDEYISAEQTQGYCGEFAQKAPRKISMAETMKGKTISGDNVGRSERVTGDEYGMRRALTGTQYTRPSEIGNAPSKVGASATLRGGNVTGTILGRRERMTGDEPGSCRNITGDDYVGQEQYRDFCEATPAPRDRKVDVSTTLAGRNVTGSMAGRSQRVTGNEPGTCKAVTGTPYAGGEQYQNYCEPQQAAEVQARTRPERTWGKPMTGQQPGVGGTLTGADKGACESVSGTPYVGADQAATACPATAADPSSPDFPQPIGAAMPWSQFSVSQPSGGAAHAAGSTGVTGNRYENSHITGPFGMASGKVTGTEEARFGKDKVQADSLRPEVVAQEHEGRVKSRITGEGQDSGLKITGDDWERNEHVTGTEGRSATLRNPTIRMGMPVRSVEQKRNEDLPAPNSKVTGGSGNTEKGSLITYSGGARG